MDRVESGISKVKLFRMLDPEESVMVTVSPFIKESLDI